jgi:hypothetical protein
MIAASTPTRSIGCSVTSAASAGVRHIVRKSDFARTARYSGDSVRPVASSTRGDVQRLRGEARAKQVVHSGRRETWNSGERLARPRGDPRRERTDSAFGGCRNVAIGPRRAVAVAEWRGARSAAVSAWPAGPVGPQWCDGDSRDALGANISSSIIVCCVERLAALQGARSAAIGPASSLATMRVAVRSATCASLACKGHLATRHFRERLAQRLDGVARGHGRDPVEERR